MTVRKHTPHAIVEALKRNGGSRKNTAAELGITKKCLHTNLVIAKDMGLNIPESAYKNDRRGYFINAVVETAHESAPDGFRVKGVSTLYDEKGGVRAQWVKTTTDEEARQAAMEAAARALAEKLPREKATKAPAKTNDELCNLYTITDYHLGMLAWHREGGADWDLKIAENTLVGCFRQMLASSPAAKVGIINQLGDFLHTDSLLPLTPTSHNVLDADSRFQKIVEAATRLLRQLVNMALAKHERVHILMAEGNHDIASSVWLRVMFAALYEKEPRVTVDQSPLPYYVYQHGKTMLAFHHGHLSKHDQGLALLFAAKYPTIWGETEKRYCHTGHKHHVDEKEHPGMTITQHPTLAAPDAHAARGGWISERQAQSITYHARFGQVGRSIVTPEMLEAA